MPLDESIKARIRELPGLVNDMSTSDLQGVAMSIAMDLTKDQRIVTEITNPMLQYAYSEITFDDAIMEIESILSNIPPVESPPVQPAQQMVVPEKTRSQRVQERMSKLGQMFGGLGTTAQGGKAATKPSREERINQLGQMFGGGGGQAKPQFDMSFGSGLSGLLTQQAPQPRRPIRAAARPKRRIVAQQGPQFDMSFGSGLTGMFGGGKPARGRQAKPQFDMSFGSALMGRPSKARGRRGRATGGLGRSLSFGSALMGKRRGKRSSRWF